MEILAFIGLAVILWFIGKTLSKVGRSLDSLADTFADRYISPKQIKKTFEKEQEADRMIPKNKFKETVQEEIDLLEKQMNERI
jgi:uncharacterized protein YoxC